MFDWKRPKINEKEAVDGQFLNLICLATSSEFCLVSIFSSILQFDRQKRSSTDQINKLHKLYLDGVLSW